MQTHPNCSVRRNEKESAAIAAENAKKASVENTETDDELMKELLERAEADGSEDEEE